MEEHRDRKALLQVQAREKMRYMPMRNLLRSGLMENTTYLNGPLLVYVINFSTKNPYPHKFLYPICTKRLENGRFCGKSLQFGQRQCDHDSFAKGAFTYTYRFGVLLSDAEHDGNALPLWCQISQAASLLLGVEAKVFREWTEQEQYRHVRDAILKVPRCEVYLRVERREATVHILERTFPTLNRPLSPYLPETSSKDKGKGKIQDIVEEQDELRDGVTSPLDAGKGETQEIVEERAELRDGETSIKDKGKGKMQEIVEVQGELRDGETSIKDKGKGKMREIVEVQGELRGGGHVSENVEEMDDGPDESQLRPSYSSIVYFPSRSSQRSLSNSEDGVKPYVPSFIASQFPPSSSDDQVKPWVKLSTLVKKARNKLIAILRGRRV